MAYMSQQGYDKLVAELHHMESVERQAASAAIAEARDSILPAEIHFSERDAFPWGDFLQKLAILWQLSRNDSIPKEFQLKKPLPPKIVELIPQIPSNKALEVLKKLGSNGFFSAFSKFNPPAF